MDHGRFRDQLLFAIGFAVSRSRDLLRRIVKEHASDNAGSSSPSASSSTSSNQGLRSMKRARRSESVRLCRCIGRRASRLCRSGFLQLGTGAHQLLRRSVNCAARPRGVQLTLGLAQCLRPELSSYCVRCSDESHGAWPKTSARTDGACIRH
jgi:hypothetical protein